MNVLDAAYSTGHDYPGGCESLAPRIGVGAAVLRNKLNPNTQTHHLTLVEADRMMAAAEDYRILHALALNHSHVCIKVDSDMPASDLAVLELVTHVWRSNGDVGSAVDDTLSDGLVERHEIARVEEAIYRTQQAMNAMLLRLKELAR